MAKTFREISGAEFKTPESLCWLMKHRQWIHGRINQLERLLKGVPEELQRLRHQLAAIDTTMQLHEIQVDPALLKPVRRKYPRLAPYGALSRHILTHLRRNRGTAQTTSQITIYVVEQLRLPLTRAIQSKVRRSVISAVNHLRRIGLVTGEVSDRGYENGHNGEASWSLTGKEHVPRHPR